MTTFAQPLTRREALQRVIGASIALAGLDLTATAAPATVPGIGRDPNLLKKEIPWPRVLTEAEKKACTALCDFLLPEDDLGPAASKLGVPDFIDEWVSAPYDVQEKDRTVIQPGLGWLDEEAQKRFAKVFADATPAQQKEFVDDIIKEGTEARRAGYDFYRLFRDRASAGYFTTPEGWNAIGYVGNKPIAEFPGPPPEVMKHLGLA